MPEEVIPPPPKQPPPRAPEPPLPARRWVDRLTGLLLLGAAGGTLVAAGPALLLRAGVTLPGFTPRDDEPRLFHIPAPREPAPPPEPPSADDDDSPWGEPRVTELERLYPDAPWPGRRRPIADSPDPGAPVRLEDMRLARARQEVRLHDQPSDGALTVGALKKGARAVIVKDAGSWVFVVTGEETKGWAKKSELQIR